MTTTFRRTRSLFAVAAAGLLVFGAAGCGAINETKKASASESPSTGAASPTPAPSASELPDPTESPTTQGSTDPNPASPSDGGGDAPAPGPGGLGSGAFPAGSEVAELDPTPLTEQEKEQGKQLMSDLLVKITVSGDFTVFCDTVVFKSPDGKRYRMDSSPETREQCAQLYTGQFPGAGGAGGEGGAGIPEEQVKSEFDPAKFELKDNGDGTYALTMSGQPLGFNVLKIKDGGVRLEPSQMDLTGQP
ncbi:hypothetical protein M3D48_04685 [Dermabacter vaginalis]|uniref:hypothetical protein n=1 Tax=Dermabacter vaginalis TaxID=1630135 RepID=UPI00092CB1E7|nr:hypothetical protein [Dermabacter vaginalis]MCT2149918.1 hypothetical protein [Dermabacter vaginalis]SHX00643.1 Uncharacterised protein [Mycobacteroides abscessus subsp. abscessus]